MHRNTYLLVVGLAVFAALVVGVNIGKRISNSPENSPVQTPSPVLSPMVNPATSTTTFQSTTCGISFEYPSALTPMESATGSAILIDKKNSDQSVIVTCQKDIPRPAIAAEYIEAVSIAVPENSASIAAKLYHESSQKDGTRIDELIFTHPETGLDVFIAGFGETFNAIIKTIKLIP